MWLDQFEFAGFYIAKEKGFYEKVGLDVEIKKYEPNINLTQKVLDKEADFGLNSSSILIDKSKGSDVVLLGAIFQSSPLMLMALEESDIKSIKDIKDKTIMIVKDQENFATFQTMLKSQGLELSHLNFIQHTFNVDDLINKKTDLMSAYITNEPFVLREKGYHERIFHPKDYGFDFYEDIIFTSKEFANANPTIVKDFYSATMKGWEYAFENIEETAKLIYEKYNPQNKSLNSLIYEANEMKKLVYDKNGHFGTISQEKINLISNIYRVMGLINQELNVDNLIYTKHLENDLTLTEIEKQYLIKKREITMCIDPDWFPYEKIENGNNIGISADFMKIISEKINTPIKLVPTKSWSESLEKAKNKECDIIPLAMETAKRKEYLDFTAPYIKLPIVIAGNIKSPFVNDLTELKNKKIGIPKDHAHYELLKSKYPHINFVEVIDTNDGLEKLYKENIYAYIGTLSIVGKIIQDEYVSQLKVIGKLDETIDLSIASRNDEHILGHILEKALESIPQTKREEILNNWIKISYVENTQKEFPINIFIGLIIFFAILFLIYRQYLLNSLNKDLSQKIEEEIKKNEEKNRILIQQSRMASMGEMLENIAHQWRQPLSTISVCASGMELKKEMDMLSDEDFYRSLNHIKQSTSYLSNTIDDFRNFFSRDKVLNKIELSNLINRTFDLVAPTFSKHQINVVKELDNIEFYSLENELIQVIMNILVNAKDALKEKLSEDDTRLIFTEIKKTDSEIVIIIRDNATGIRDDVIDKIFEPYFTTKHKSNGTGIGLYMSKILTEKHLKGDIQVRNVNFEYENKTYKGAEFTIILPIEEVAK